VRVVFAAAISTMQQSATTRDMVEVFMVSLGCPHHEYLGTGAE
jgi:hypothetical protein